MNEPFSIFELTAEKTKEIFASPPAPHRHDYEEIIIVTKGSPYHFIDFKKEKLTAPAVLYVAKGKVHQFLPDIRTRGWAIRYNNEFLPETGFHFYSDFLDNINYSLSSADCLKNTELLCKIMQQEVLQENINYSMIRHLLGALVAKLEAEGKKRYADDSEVKNPDLITLNNFLRILDGNFRRNETVEFYAEKMNMTARHLNRICKNILDKSVSEIIESRKLTEARRLLLESSKTISEIGFEVGYSEKSYFTRVFHRKTGLTPTAFKEKMQAMLA